jgi:hypothetical protein
VVSVALDPNRMASILIHDMKYSRYETITMR